MPNVGDTLFKPAADSLAVAVKTGAPAWILLVVFLAGFFGVLFAAYKFISKSMNSHQVLYFTNLGDILLKSVPGNKNYFEYKDNKHLFDPTKSSYYWRFIFPWKVPAHIFREGVSIEQTIGKEKVTVQSEITVSQAIFPGNDNRNSEYLAANQKAELAAHLFAQKTDMAMVIMAGVVGLLLGIIIGYVLPIAIAANKPTAPVKK
jgi:hypothetical protein